MNVQIVFEHCGHFKGAGGVFSSGLSELSLLVFILEGSHSYLELLTESKNINPSRSYRIFKIGKYIARTNLKSRIPENMKFQN